MNGGLNQKSVRNATTHTPDEATCAPADGKASRFAYVRLQSNLRLAFVYNLMRTRVTNINTHALAKIDDGSLLPSSCLTVPTYIRLQHIWRLIRQVQT
jgi:hypothetical protein